MASDSDSLGRSSTTGTDAITPLTTSSSSEPGAASASGQRVHAARQSSSVPADQTGFVVTLELPKRPATTVTNRSPSPKRQYKPTVALDEYGDEIYYDDRLSTKWRKLKTGHSARPPAEHQIGGRYFDLPLPPDYSHERQNAELWAARGGYKVVRGSSEPVDCSSAAASAKTLKALKTLAKGKSKAKAKSKPPTSPTTTPRLLTPRQKTKVRSRGSSPATPPTATTPVIDLTLEDRVNALESLATAAATQMGQIASFPIEATLSNIATIVDSSDQSMVDEVFAKSRIIEIVDDNNVEQLQSCYTEMSNQKARITLLESSLSAASASNTEILQSYRSNVEESRKELTAMKEQIGNSGMAVTQLSLAQIEIDGLKHQLKLANDRSSDADLKDALSKTEGRLAKEIEQNNVMRDTLASAPIAFWTSDRVESEVEVAEQKAVAAIRQKNEQLVSTTEELRSHLLTANADRLNVKREADSERAQMKSEIAELELHCRSRRISKDQVDVVTEELIEVRKEAAESAKEVTKYEGYLQLCRAEIDEFHDERDKILSDNDDKIAEMNKNFRTEMKEMRDKVDAATAHKIPVFDMSKQDEIVEELTKELLSMQKKFADEQTEYLAEAKEAKDEQTALIKKADDWSHAYENLKTDEEWYAQEYTDEENIVKAQATELATYKAVQESSSDHYNSLKQEFSDMRAQDLKEALKLAVEGNRELDSARREIAALEAASTRKEKGLEEARAVMVDLQNKNNQLKSEVKRRTTERSSTSIASSWNMVHCGTSSSAEIPLNNSNSNQAMSSNFALTNSGIDRDAQPNSGTDAALGEAFTTGGIRNDTASSDRILGITEESQQEGEGEEEPLERSPDLSSDISISPEMAKMEMWMNDRMKQQQEQADALMARCEAAEEALAKKTRTDGRFQRRRS